MTKNKSLTQTINESCNTKLREGTSAVRVYAKYEKKEFEQYRKLANAAKHDSKIISAVDYSVKYDIQDDRDVLRKITSPFNGRNSPENFNTFGMVTDKETAVSIYFFNNDYERILKEKGKPYAHQVLARIKGAFDYSRTEKERKKIEYTFFEEMFWINKSVSMAIGYDVVKNNKSTYDKALKDTIAQIEENIIYYRDKMGKEYFSEED